ncbi:MAG: isoprenylcysteine carboxylmethyltransferase family protein [Acidobacteriia bacterium]|nr:isoprenylcysteine carboxylmethyltransferase family protein [Terriglobia bacterium]
MMLYFTLWAVVALFPASEIVLAVVKRANPSLADVQDRGSMRLLWAAISLGVALAIVTRGVPEARLPGSPGLLGVIALVLMVLGLGIRWTAIITLGRLFTVDVAIQREHTVVETGLYHYVRHPSYAGLLIAFVGLGVSFGNWLGMLLLLLPITLAVGNRILKEERALTASLGAAYASYCARTKRLVPGVF